MTYTICNTRRRIETVCGPSARLNRACDREHDEAGSGKTRDALRYGALRLLERLGRQIGMHD